MKKLTVMLALLALTSVASAGLSLTVNGVIPSGQVGMREGETISIGVFGDDVGGVEPMGTFFIGVTVTSDAGSLTKTDAMILYPGFLTGWGDNVSLDPEVAAILGVRMDYAAISLVDVVMPPATSMPLLGQLVDGIQFHREGPEGITIKLFNDDGLELNTMFDGDGVALSTIYIASVPEPMTLGLLGLGGLFLRRRIA